MNLTRRSLLGGTSAALVAIFTLRPARVLAEPALPSPKAGVGCVWELPFWSRNAGDVHALPKARADRPRLEVPAWHPEFI